MSGGIIEVQGSGERVAEFEGPVPSRGDWIEYSGRRYIVREIYWRLASSDETMVATVLVGEVG